MRKSSRSNSSTSSTRRSSPSRDPGTAAVHGLGTAIRDIAGIPVFLLLIPTSHDKIAEEESGDVNGRDASDREDVRRLRWRRANRGHAHSSLAAGRLSAGW